MKKVLFLALLAIPFAFANTGCGISSSGGSGNGGGGGTGGAFAAKAQGLWIEKAQGEELRQTGKLNSVCGEIKANPNDTYINMVKVEPTGAVFLYTPATGTNPAYKLGDIDANGKLKVASEASLDITVEVSNDQLTFTVKTNGQEQAFIYLKSSDEEAVKNYAALDECRR